MKLENQCCTREQGAQLTRLGVDPRKSVFEHCVDGSSHPIILRRDGTTRDSVPAFTVAELGVMLIGEDQGETTVWSGGLTDYKLRGEKIGDALTEAEGRAALLIHLLEVGETTAAEVNARLSA